MNINILIPPPEKLVTVCIYLTVSEAGTIRFSKTQQWGEWKPVFENSDELIRWIRTTPRRGRSEEREIPIGSSAFKVFFSSAHPIATICRMRLESDSNKKGFEDELLGDGWREVSREGGRYIPLDNKVTAQQIA